CRRCRYRATERHLQAHHGKTAEMMHYPQVTTELFTIRDWLRFTVSRFEESSIFFGHGTDNAYDEAVWLILSALHLPLDTLDNFIDARITEPERKHLLHLIERRISEH